MRSAFGQSFEVPAGYLNTAGIGVPPVVAAESVVQAVHRWRTGADSPAAFDADVLAARRAWAGLVGVDVADVTSGASVSQLVGLVAASVPDGTRVLAVRGEFTSVTFPFAAQGHRGVTVTEVAPEHVVSSVDDHDLVAVSVVQSADGAVADLDGLREAAASAGARVLFDATQAAGWLPLRLSWADWVVGACYKWLVSPRGAAWLASRPEVREEMVPHTANWSAGADPWDSIYGLPLRLAGDARAFDVSPTWFSQVGAAAAIPWLASLDQEAVRAHCVGLADTLLTELGQQPRGSAIISLDMPDGGQALTEAGIASSVRAGRVRLAFHLYNTADDVEMVLSALR